MHAIINRNYKPTTSVPPALNLSRARSVLHDIEQWPGYAPTSLVSLPGLASQLCVAGMWLKNEGERFGVTSFKPMGGAYAISQLVARAVEDETGTRPTAQRLFDNTSRAIADRITVACATEGNHGRAVAWAARQFGCHAVVYMAHNVTPKREAAIAALGARVVRSAGNHEDAMREMVKEAGPAKWHIISETKSASDERIAWDTLVGYGALWLEAFDQMEEAIPTHLFVQAGVGGLAAAACAMSRQRWPEQIPRVVVVESVKADCVLRSMRAGERVTVGGKLDTMMAGLAAGEVSDFAWQILKDGAVGCIAIEDKPAAEAMRLLAAGTKGDMPVGVGESGIAGITAAMLALCDEDSRAMFGLTTESRILTVATEGVTDPDTYRAIVANQR